MELLVSRYERSTDGTASIGKLFLEGAYECFTLEDMVREDGLPVTEWKIPHLTAIPCGRYRVSLVWSPKHRCMVPLVEGVEGFTAIEVHWGNTPKDTDGCTLVGRTHRPGQAFIGESNLAWDALMPKLELPFGVRRDNVDERGKPVRYVQVAEPEEIWITYRNDFSPEVIGPDPFPGDGS